ncbi:MAG: hypothetical protein AAFV32_07755 [Myxococcota bacterium]
MADWRAMVLCGVTAVVISCGGGESSESDNREQAPPGMDDSATDGNSDSDGGSNGSPGVEPPPVGTTQGDGTCEPGENPLNSPDDCPKEAGDGFCSHDENAESAPLDCPTVAGDGVCTGVETAANTPEDCDAVLGDGACTHSENAANAEADCPAVDGDALCTHSETPVSTPSDCPAAAGDGFCSHDENAATVPEDCPAVAGDGFCTHSETFSSAPQDCPAPSLMVDDATVSGLRSVSPDLVFDQLMITGTLELQSAAFVTISANTIEFARGSQVRSSPTACDFSDAPRLTLLANDRVRLFGEILLSGKSGVPTTLSSSCNECDGSNAGSLTVSANSIDLGGFFLASGGNGSNTVVSTSPQFIRIGCDGGNGGTVELTGQFITVSNALSQSSGSGGSGNSSTSTNDDGDDGDWGRVFVNGGNVTFNERSGINSTPSGAQQVAIAPMLIQGVVSVNDDSETEDNTDAVFLTYNNGTVIDFAEDLYRISNHRADVQDKTFRYTLAWSGSADLDLVLLDIGATGVLTESTNTSGNQESIIVSDARVGDQALLVVNRRNFSSGAVTYSITVTEE